MTKQQRKTPIGEIGGKPVQGAPRDTHPLPKPFNQDADLLYWKLRQCPTVLKTEHSLKSEDIVMSMETPGAVWMECNSQKADWNLSRTLYSQDSSEWLLGNNFLLNIFKMKGSFEIGL